MELVNGKPYCDWEKINEIESNTNDSKTDSMDMEIYKRRLNNKVDSVKTGIRVKYRKVNGQGR